MSYFKPFVLNWPGGNVGSDDEGEYETLDTTLKGVVRMFIRADGEIVPAQISIDLPEGYTATTSVSESSVLIMLEEDSGGGDDGGAS